MKYFDYAATCPLDEEAAQVYVKAATEYYGNAQSLHDTGSQAKELLENCRHEFAKLLGVMKEGIYFTSGGSESNFLAIQSLLSSSLKKGKHIITGIAEHSSILSTLEKLTEDDYEVTALPLNSLGQIDLEQVRNAIREDTVLITIQHGNPETGILQPLEEINKICKEHQILFHSDCVQTFGKAELKTVAQFVDSLSISGHKFYGPKGTGAVYIHPRFHWKAFYPGASHEKGFRPGTVNVPGIAAMTVAAQKALGNLEDHIKKVHVLRKTFLNALDPIKENCIIYGLSDSRQLPSTIGMRIIGLEGQYVMLECNRYGFAISTGSACQVGMQSPSKTMKAMGVSGKSGKEFIRISFGWKTTERETQELGEALVKIVNQSVRT
ncbi:IscS subfamily cysteine desulfurase [Bacillus sp. FJAT-29790]|uniref:IscS subfamily cysteine desulfurase n=1 Tax=Bacillus sp. FJAT-29790 TaxID=1895002 RepID=UPI001C231AC4|nr:IscS subfamily cysteine desulfurase [Bacillus sp. FJAT-29790]MBU8879541.1 IscS subfamily cysteine desulfurase [Bacillus sp. FJAT-29790]